MKKIIILFIAVTLILSACGESINGEQSNLSAEVNVSDDINEVVRIFDSGLVINANVYPKDIDISKAHVYKGEVKRLDFDLFYENLLQNKTVLEETEQESAESFFGDLYKFIRYDDTAFFSFMEHSANYTALATLDLHSGIEKLNLPIGNERFNYIGKDLSFKTVEDANMQAREIFERLGVEILDVYDCYSLNKNEIPIVSEDGYILEYYVGKDGIPVTKNLYGSYANGILTVPSNVTAQYTKDGLMGVSVSNVYIFSDKLEDESAIPLEEAIEKLEQKYSNIILEEEQTVTRIDFSYYPVFTEEFNVYEMTPAWSFYIEAPTEYEYPEQKLVLINAVDGSEIFAELGG